MISKISHVPLVLVPLSPLLLNIFVYAHDSSSKEDSEGFVANTESNIEFVFNLMIATYY